METRALNLRALDLLGELGNRTPRNTFLEKAFAMFFGPLGIVAQGVEFSLIECAGGHYPRLSVRRSKLDMDQVRLAQTHLDLFNQIVQLGSRIELESEYSMTFRLRASKDSKLTDDQTAELVTELNARVLQAEDYFRAFSHGAVHTLAAETGAEKLQEIFLESPALFAEQFALILSQQAQSNAT